MRLRAERTEQLSWRNATVFRSAPHGLSLAPLSQLSSANLNAPRRGREATTQAKVERLTGPDGLSPLRGPADSAGSEGRGARGGRGREDSSAEAERIALLRSRLPHIVVLRHRVAARHALVIISTGDPSSPAAALCPLVCLLFLCALPLPPPSRCRRLRAAPDPPTPAMPTLPSTSPS